MKFRWLLVPLGLFIALGISAQTIDAPSGVNIFSTSTLTNVYTASSSVDVQSWDSVSVVANVGTTQANAIANLKLQWSYDNSTWVDHPVLTAQSIANQETPYTLSSKQITISLSNSAPAYIEVLPRNARYFRTVIKSTNAFTTGTISINVQKMNNNTGATK
jgi:hypothetical protein